MICSLKGKEQTGKKVLKIIPNVQLPGFSSANRFTFYQNNLDPVTFQSQITSARL